MFASFEAPRQEMTGASLKVALYGPHDVKPPVDDQLIAWHKKRNASFLKLVHTSSGQYSCYGDGLVVDTTRLAGLNVRDCHVVVLYSTIDQTALLLHCGRQQLTPNKDRAYGTYGRTIISVALRFFSERGIRPSATRAVLVRGICGRCFTHRDSAHKEKTDAFLEYFGGKAFAHNADRGLDLEYVIETMLKTGGIQVDRQIDHIGACTVETSALGSKRGEDGLGMQNLVTVAWQQTGSS